MTANHKFNKAQVSSSFSRFASSYDNHAFIQHEVGRRLIERMQLLKAPPKRILDIGSGTGALTPLLKAAFPKAEIIELDRSWGMLKIAKSRVPLWKKWLSINPMVLADMEILPFQKDTFDLIYSNCTFQWANDLLVLFKEIERILKPEGNLFFTTLGPDTLKELKSCFAKMDNSAHIHDFMDLHPIGDFLLQASLRSPVVDQEHIVVTYQSLEKILNDLKNTGARNMAPQRKRGLMPPGKLKHLQTAFDELLVKHQHFPCTYEIIYGHAHKKARQLARIVPIELRS